jgi:hypothetical protein
MEPLRRLRRQSPQSLISSHPFLQLGKKVCAATLSKKQSPTEAVAKRPKAAKLLALPRKVSFGSASHRDLFYLKL